jgi:centrosomal protein CEP104
VAISLSNLAILHNQRGEYSQAQPLYERALEIFELNFGLFDANVAHTLTDLAVLHLEQVSSNPSNPSQSFKAHTSNPHCAFSMNCLHV